jgi:hypothetical protein
MEIQKYIKYIGLVILCLSTVIIYFLLTNRYTSVVQSLNFPFIISYTSVDISENITTINETISNLPFESRLSNWYPHLPIHIFTQNLSLLSDTSKLILIGNGFFGDRDWGVAPPGRSSTEISTSNIDY